MPSPAAIKAVRVRIRGRVQGVFFRAWTVEEATRLGLEGWVRNRADGSLEALFSGPRATVDGMVEACREGPPFAVITRIEISAAAPPPGGGFRALATV